MFADNHTKVNNIICEHRTYDLWLNKKAHRKSPIACLDRWCSTMPAVHRQDCGNSCDCQGPYLESSPQFDYASEETETPSSCTYTLVPLRQYHRGSHFV